MILEYPPVKPWIKIFGIVRPSYYFCIKISRNSYMSEHNENLAEEPLSSYEQPLNFEKVWQMFQETDRRFKETDRQFKETDRQFKETDRQFKETDKRLQKLNNLFTTQWGKLMESLIEPSCLKLFRERGIDIKKSYSNVKIEQENGFGNEFDIVLANGKEVVFIEVKTTMTVEKVNEFLEKLTRIRTWFPEYKDKTIYAAIAGVRYEESSDKYGYRKGLFVLTNTGEGIIKIANNKDFKPTTF